MKKREACIQWDVYGDAILISVQDSETLQWSSNVFKAQTVYDMAREMQDDAVKESWHRLRISLNMMWEKVLFWR